METDLKKDQNNVTNTEQPSSSILSQVRIMKSYHLPHLDPKGSDTKGDPLLH